MNKWWSEESKMNEEGGEQKKQRGNPMDEWYEWNVYGVK
jgi:hypothetical protein